MSKIKVLIVDDSPFIHRALGRIFEDDPEIEVVGIARNGREAVSRTTSLQPDVITLDIMMPEMDGIETLREIMKACPTPVLMLSQYTHEGAALTLNALELGAMDFVDKSTTGFMNFSSLAKEIVTKIKAIAGQKPQAMRKSPVAVQEYTSRGLIDVVAIGTSTGGPPALQMILPKFPRNIDFGVLIVQHMPRGFTGPLAERLDAMSRITVREAADGDRIEPGCALIAPSGVHMKVKKGSAAISLDPEPQNSLHRPSVDVLFDSVAEKYGPRTIGVLLTGMGADGAAGLGTIHKKGGFTIAQDESTSTIFGMPRVAIERKVVDSVLPVTEIAEEILKRA